MSRACFLSAAGDPFIALLAIRLFQERWYDEVDAFYVNYNNHAQVPKEVVAEFCSRVVKDPKIHLIYHPQGIGSGVPITEMTLLSKEDLVMLLEEDGYIFTPGAVDECFRKIEAGLVDAVGSPRFSCDQEVAEAIRNKYGLNYSSHDNYEDKGPNYWPNFFFCKRKDLLRTDLDFGSHTWRSGEYCQKLDHTFKFTSHGDTFVWACIQLRALGLRFLDVPQHHADPYEAENKENKEMNWRGEPMKWIHAGSLSSGWGSYLSGVIPDVSDEVAKREMETRVAFWTIASDVIEGFMEFKKEYKRGIENLIIGASLNRGRINKKVNIYRELLNV